MEQTVKKKFGIRDIMTIAAMMVITYLVAMVIGSVTLPLPVVYLYGSAGVNNGELVPSARSNCTTLPKQEYRLAGWLYRSATALCQRCEPLFR